MKIFFFNSNINVLYHLGNFKMNYNIFKNIELLIFSFEQTKTCDKKCLYLQEYYVSPIENFKTNQLFDIHVLNCQSTTKLLHFTTM